MKTTGTEQNANGSGNRSPPTYSLIVYDGFGRRQAHPVGGRISAGRHYLNDVRLEDASVSRFHFMIVSDTSAGLCYLLDMNSLNGTWLNGRRVGQISTLRNGDEIRIGRTLLLEIITGDSN